MADKNERKDQILKYWMDEKFSAAYSGVATLRLALKHEAGLNFTIKEVRDALLSVPNYVMKIRRATKFPTRPYWVTGSFLEWSVDIGLFLQGEVYCTRF